ncbi:MAG: ATP-binding protein [Saprospiraceae bacterium]|jgi:predicted AAA+ superfamily ATPase|nr:ATP-binding protein [Saprospiraceae bacterium]
MIARELTGTVLENLAHFPVTGIIGPRQVGKTTLAKSILSTYDRPFIHLDLELDSDLRKLDEAETFLRFHQDKLVVIDEIQRLPRLFPLLRALVDERRVPGRFLILGSASPSVIRESSESLAGRIAYSELTPVSLRELAHSLPMEQHWLRGGFPEPLLMQNPTIAWRWLDNFINTFLERDLRILGYEIAPEAMRRTLQMLTNYHGNLLNVSEISRSLGISAPTVNRYLDILEGSFLIHRLAPYFVNIGKRLVKAPKFYFRDSGIFHALSGINTYEQLLDNRARGASWEGYAIEQIRRAAPERWQFFFYRAHTGAEADLVLQSATGDIYLAEIKLSLSTGVTRGFFHSGQDLQPKGKFVIIPEGDAFPRADGTLVCGLEEFLGEMRRSGGDG